MVYITHPDLPGSLQTVPESVYELVLKANGWELTDSPEELERQGRVAAMSMTPLPDLTIDAVLAQVGDDPVLAAGALEAERNGKSRKTLLASLERIANPEGD